MANLIQLMGNTLDQRDQNLPVETKRIILKELLQAFALDFLYNHSTYRKLNFYGGTCLHIFYGLNRLSEDIDLDNSTRSDLRSLEEDLSTYFRSSIGYAEVSANSQVGGRGILRTTLKFPVLFALGLTSHQNEALHLKVEISQHKQISVLRKSPAFLFGKSFVASHFSIETMMAGKIIACLERDFNTGVDAAIKGRDYYDLLWFMQQKINPLEEKLKIDGLNSYTVRSAMELLGRKVEAIKLPSLADDLLPLFENRQFIESWLESFKENFFLFREYYL